MTKKSVYSDAFSLQTTITSVKFGSLCAHVGENAFFECISLEKINDNNEIESIGSNAFAGTKLTTANFSKLNELYDGAFNNCRNLTCVSIPKCENIPQNAFCECINLSDINFDNCYTIGDMAFTSCERLSKVNLKKCVSIGASAFSGCNNITQVELSICEKIGSNAFANCTNLTNVYINNESDVFCSLMSEYVFCTHDISSPSICSINSNITFHFRAEVLDTYKSATNWSHYSKYMTKIDQPNQIIYKTNDNNIIKVNCDESNSIRSNSYFTNSNYGVIEFEQKVKSLNDNMFKNARTLTSINVPSECETIGSNTFEGCENLINFTHSNVLKEIGNYAFKDCKALTTFTIPNTVETLGSNAFEGCENLINFTHSNGLRDIGNYAFKNCKSLTTFTIPDTIETLGEAIFAGCENIEKFEGKFVTYDNRAIVYEKKLVCVLSKDNSYTEGRIHRISEIDSTITSLGKSCFNGCVNMRRVDISPNVTSIGDYAFENCENLYEVHFKETAPEIGADIFKNINTEFKIFVPEESISEYHSKWENSGYTSHIYPMPKNNEIIYYSSSEIVAFSDHIVNDFDNGVYYKTSLSNISENLPHGVLPNIFEHTNVEKIILGAEIMSISEYAFKDCNDLSYVYISDNIMKFNTECFCNCTSLSRIHIPKKCVFGEDIFYGCTNLKEFGTYYKGYVSDDNRCYVDKDNRILMFFAQRELEEKSYIIPDNIIEINRSAFRNSNIESIKLNSSTKTIGEYAFENCENLQTIDGWDNVEVICGHAFSECSNLGEISFPSKLTKIGENGFTNCGKMYIKNNLPDSVEEIGNNAFEKCTNFKCIDDSLNLSNIKYIGTATFSDCEWLTKVKINSNIESINDRAFQYCKRLENLNLIECKKLTYIGLNAFDGCESYTGSLVIPTNVTSIGDCCFRNSGIEKVNTNSKINTIPQYAFYGCEDLTHINISSNITTISNDAFNGCENLCEDTGKLELHNKITSIGDRAFYNCKNILETTLPLSLESLGDLCFKTNNANTNIYIPKDLKPPKFKVLTDESYESNPFGTADDTDPKLYVHVLDISTYKDKENPYWSKYENRFIEYSEDIYITINLDQAYIDSEFLNKKIKVTDVGAVDKSDYIYLYNSAWKCYNNSTASGIHIESESTSDFSVNFHVNKVSMSQFLNDRKETKYSTLNISIPMRTKIKKKKFRIIVSIANFGSVYLYLSNDNFFCNIDVDDVMLSMGTYAESNYSKDCTNRIKTYFNNKATNTSKLYLMGDTNTEEKDEKVKENQTITVPKEYVFDQGKYQIIPSRLYITGNNNGDNFRVSVYLYNSGWEQVTDGGELYRTDVFSLLGWLYQFDFDDSSTFENALEIMGMSSSDRGVQINISEEM